MRRLIRVLILGVIGCVMLASGALAHTRSQSFSTWTADGNALHGAYQVDAYRVTQLSETPQDVTKLLISHLAETVALVQGGKACAMDAPRRVQSGRGDVRVEMRFVCPRRFGDAQAVLFMNSFFDVSISHSHYVRVSYAGGRVDELVLSKQQTKVVIGALPLAAARSSFGFLTLGYFHVLSGFDHLVFLLALVLLSGGTVRTLLAVTGFTLGHSLTLALVTLGVLKPDTATVEALIGFTVAWAAGDAVARRRELSPWLGLVGAAGIALMPLPWLVASGLALFAATMSFARVLNPAGVAPAIATIFGLAHGAGFAGPLLELKILPADLFWTLLSFNLGVELGQLTALGVLGAVWWAVARSGLRVPAVGFDAVAAALFGLGTYWFLSRALS